MASKRRGGRLVLAVIGAALVINVVRRCDQSGSNAVREARRNPTAPVVNPIEEMLARSPAAPVQEGVAAAILLDSSGSMADKVADGSGRQRPKIDIARESVADLVRRFEGYAREHPDRKVAVGIYEFSRREHQPSSRTVVPISAPDLEGAAAALKRVRAKGGTPIGDAMIEAKRALDATGLTRRHILVVTDGENTHGYAPADVTGVLSRQQESRRASVYFVAFDVEAELFKPVRDAGGLVLGAANETDLRQTLDYLLTGKILAEQPSTPAVR